MILLVTGYLTWRVRVALVREERQHEASRLAASVFEHSGDGITITDAQTRIVAVNPAFERITGYSATDAIGRTPNMLSSRVHDSAFYRAMWASIESLGTWQGEIVDRRKDGSLLTEWLTINAIRDVSGRIVNYVGVFKDLSRIRADEATIRRLSQAIEQSPSSIVITSTEPAIEYVNPQFFRATGYTPEEVIGANPRLLQSGLTPLPTYESMWAALTAGQSWTGEFVNRRKDGTIYYERASVAPLTDAAGQVTHYLGIKHDITAEKVAEKALRLAASVIAHTHEGVLICDDTQRIIDVNPAFTQITGYQRDEVLGRTPRLLASGRQGPEFYRAMWVALERDGHWQGEFWNRRKDGGLYAALSDVSAVRDDSGRITHYINLFSDITQLKHHQERLELLAHFDPLTRLPNRSLLSDRLQQGLARAARERTWLAVCFLDLDGFKAINDIHGHEAGDELLVAVARRLEDGIRGGDTAARLGGDEFVLLLGGISSVAECELAANRILRAIEQPIPVQGQALHVSASLGITLFPQDSADAEQLMRHADHAMYQAKQLGRNRYFLYDAACDQEARDHRRRTEEIARALEREEFCRTTSRSSICGDAPSPASRR